jgi:NADPH-dependent glutamate synthase beta subunit-like oxidoreductase
VNTREFLGQDGRLRELRCVKIEWANENGRCVFKDVPRSDFGIKADLALLALGFAHVEHGPLVRELHLAADERGGIRVSPACMTSTDGVFAAGDAVLGASLVVRAIDHGRRAAAAVDAYLAGK